MTFTDDDLKRLKLRLDTDYFVRNKFVDAQEMVALLARLDAAEKVADMMYSMPPIHPDDGSNKMIAEAQKAWRKVAGEP